VKYLPADLNQMLQHALFPQKFNLCFRYALSLQQFEYNYRVLHEFNIRTSYQASLWLALQHALNKFHKSFSLLVCKAPSLDTFPQLSCLSSSYIVRLVVYKDILNGHITS